MDEEQISAVRNCIEVGEFKSHNGLDLTWRLNALYLIEYYKEFMELLRPRYAVVGIEFCGAMLALSLFGEHAGILRKDGDFREPRIYHTWAHNYNLSGHKIVTLVDDVVTTEGSFMWATDQLAQRGIAVQEYCVILDRRSGDRKLSVKALVDHRTLGLPAL